jgi:hypothetical protein
MKLLQNCLSSPNVSIGDMVFQTVKTGFPLKACPSMIKAGAGMTDLGHLQEAP